MANVPMECPNCREDLRGDEIRHGLAAFGGETHFSRVIGLSDTEKVYAWRCPECGHEWERTEAMGRGFRTFDVVVSLPKEEA